ncbi:MAG: reverse transcriptase/maturase family protein [bacterium]|nr:reverse transcriptase/maturase family protein [bacterium]
MAHSFEDIISVENLCLAWEEFVSGKKKQRGVADFRRNLMDNIISLHTDLANKTYQHGTYKERHIWDPKHRLIHIPSIRDRLLHHAIYRILYPFFDRTFIGDSYSCRIDKGVHKALNRFRTMAYKVSRNHTRTCWVLKCDIRKFFASVDQATLLKLLASYVSDQNVMWLLGQVVNSFHTTRDCGSPTCLVGRQVPLGDDNCVGLPLGNLTSQLFSNIYMNEFDRFAKHRLKATHYIRYADDFVFLHEDRAWLAAQIPSVEKFLQERLHLQLHPKKVTISTFASGVDFLGWVHFPDHRVLRETTKRRMMRRLMECEKEGTLRSYLGLLGHGNAWKLRGEVLREYWSYHDL